MSAEAAPELSPREFLRWTWRQLTSMRTALLLLLLLALVAIPGSLVPQTGVDARAVEAYRLQHRDLSVWLDRLGLFHTYTSVWFSAVYLLLLVSLVGCIVPRTTVYLKAFRARPPRAPRRFERLPGATRFTVDAEPQDVMAAARAALGRARIDVVQHGNATELSAESGHWREAGNLLFHLAVVGVLLGVAGGTLFGYRGSAIVTEGDDFSNVLTQYDDFSSGALFDRNQLPPFAFHLGEVDARFQMSGPQRGAPRLFAARGTYTRGSAGGDPRPFSIRVNHPLTVDGTSVFLIGQGYAPVIRVRDPDGTVVFDDAVPFLPSDGTYTSSGVIKVPDARPQGWGFQGFFLPTAVTTGKDEAPVSAFPAAANPFLGLFVFRGDLGLDDGQPQSVFALDKTKLRQVRHKNGTPLRVSLSPGQVADLPGGGSIEFVKLKQFARLQISASPWAGIPLTATMLAVLGLVLSLSIRPRRTWVRARPAGPPSAGAEPTRTVVEIAALDRVRSAGVTDHVAAVRSAVERDRPDAEEAQ